MARRTPMACRWGAPLEYRLRRRGSRVIHPRPRWHPPDRLLRHRLVLPSRPVRRRAPRPTSHQDRHPRLRLDRRPRLRLDRRRPEAPGYSPGVRYTDFWERMEQHLGVTYARSYAHDQVLSQLRGRTVEQALADGDDAKDVWRAVVDALQRPARFR